jgi:hypothetical protein
VATLPIRCKASLLLDEEVFVTQPPDFEVRGEKNKVYQLKKTLYSLKEAPRVWNKRIDEFLVLHGFYKCKQE